MPRVTSPLTRKLREAYARSNFSIAEKREVHGVLLVDLVLNGWVEPSLPRLDLLEAALKCLADTSPIVFGRMVRDVEQVRVADEPNCRGRYLPDERAILIDRDWLESTSAAETAVTLVHEATHARLWACGFRYEAAARERIERACYRRQIRFAVRAGVDPEWVADMRLSEADPPLRSDRERIDIWADARQETLERQGAPRWLRTFVARLDHWRVRRARARLDKKSSE